MAYVYSDYFTVNEAGTYDNKSPSQAIRGELVPFYCSITGTPATADTWRFLKVPKGARLHSLMYKYADFGGTITGDLGWETADGDAFLNDNAFGTASTGDTVSDDSLLAQTVPTTEDYLSVTFSAATTPNSSTLYLQGSWFIP